MLLSGIHFGSASFQLAVASATGKSLDSLEKVGDSAEVVILPFLRAFTNCRAGCESMLSSRKSTIFQNLASTFYLLPQLGSTGFSSGALEVPIPQAYRDMNARFLAIFNVP